MREVCVGEEECFWKANLEEPLGGISQRSLCGEREREGEGRRGSQMKYLESKCVEVNKRALITLLMYRFGMY